MSHAPTATERYVRVAAQAGCPRDQVENLLRAGVVLQERQLQASAAARLCDLPDGPTELGYGGARGGGKSHWGMAQVGADDCQRYAGLKCLILRKVGKALREGVRDLLHKTIGGLAYRYVDSDQTIYFANGSCIILGHFQRESDIDAYLGLEYDVILIEEATTLSASKVTAIRTCLRTSKPGWRPRLYSTTNPGGIGHAWYKQRYIAPARRRLLLPGQSYGAGFLPLAAQTGPTRFVPATVNDNRFVNVEYRATLDGLSGWQRRAWRDGDWDIAAGQFFTNWRHERHVIESPSYTILPSSRVWLALDYGFTHYTAVYLLAMHDGMLTIVDEHCERRWLPPRHATAIKAMLGRHGQRLGDLWRFVASPDAFHAGKDRGGKTIADQYADEGITLEAASDSRIGRAGQWLSRLGDYEADPVVPHTIQVCDRCVRLIECIPLLEHDPHQPEAVLKVDTDDDGFGGDDPYDASGYGLMAAPLIITGPLAY